MDDLPPPTDGGGHRASQPTPETPAMPVEFEQLAEILDDPIVAWSSLYGDDGQIIDFVYEYVNAGAVQTIGIPADQLIGRRLLEVLPAHVELGLFDRYRIVAESGVPDNIEIPWFEDGNVAGAFEARISRIDGGILSVARNVTDRVLADQRLRRLERRTRLALDHSTEAVLHIVGGEVKWASPAIERVLGVAPESIEGTRAAAWCHPEAAHLLDRPIFDTPTPTPRLGRLRRADGAWQGVEVVSRVTDGDVVALVRTARPVDATATSFPPRMSADDPTGTTAVLDAIPEAIVVVDRGVILYGNAASRTLVGLDPHESLLDRSFGSLMSSEDIEAALAWGQRIRDGHDVEPLVTTLERADGERLRVEATASFAPGSSDALMLVLRDVTERDRLREELVRSEDTGRFLTENSTDVLLRVDRDHRIGFASSASLAVLGVAPRDLVGTSISHIFDAADRSDIGAAMRTAQVSGTAPPMEVCVPRSGPGEAMWVEVEVRCVRLETTEQAGPDAHEFHVTLYDVRRERADREALHANERRLRALVDGAPVGIFELDPRGNCTFVNARYCEILGVEGLDDVGDRRWLDLLHEDDLRQVSERWADPRSARFPFELSVRFIRPDDGRVARTIIGIAPVFDDDDEIAGWLGTVDDISERVELEHARREASELFVAAFEHAPTGLVLMTVDEFPPRMIRANNAMLELSGLTQDELREIDFYEQSHPSDVAAATSGRAALLAGEIDTHQMEIRQRFTDDGAYRWYWLVRSVVRDEDGAPKHLIAQMTDITDRKETERLHYHMAVTDSLTGLSNRRHFEDRLANTHARLLRTDHRVGVIFLDLDHFKTVNDELGHRAGDEVLQRVAEIMVGGVRPGDTVGRLGGDEFVVLAEHDDEGELLDIAERLRDAIDLPCPLPGGTTHHITASIGIASRLARSTTPDELLQLADQAMYRAKRAGRRRCMVAEPF